MGKTAIVKYEKPLESVRKAVELSGGLDHLPSGARVMIKPNIVIWTTATVFPKYGVITTSRVIEDMVVLLKERGIDDITIIEGSVSRKSSDTDTFQHACESLGYKKLNQRYGLKIMNVFERPFREVDLGGGVVLNYNTDVLDCDFLVNLPALKTHSQTVVSCGIKNLKGLIDVESRKKCHNPDPVMDLNYYVSKLANLTPPSFTLLDGIYTLERGPTMDGKARRTDLLVASADVLSADKVGAALLGHPPEDVPHLVHASKDRGRPADLSDIETVGENIEEVSSWHMPAPMYNDEGTLPLPMAKMGIKGLDYRKYDLTICTYCSGIQWVILPAIAMAWKGEPWDDIEVLTGKKMKPTPGKKKTILMGKCMYELNRDDPNINEMIAIKGCPPAPKLINKALHEAGIMIEPSVLDNIDAAPGYFNAKYEGKPGFEESFFQVG